TPSRSQALSTGAESPPAAERRLAASGCDQRGSVGWRPCSAGEEAIEARQSGLGPLQLILITGPANGLLAPAQPRPQPLSIDEYAPVAQGGCEKRGVALGISQPKDVD